MSRAGSFAGKVVVVTGGARGIGKAIAFAQAEQGANVVLLSRTLSELHQATSDICEAGHQASYQICDVCDLASVTPVFEAIENDHGPVDVLINNAGVFQAYGPIWEVDPDEWWGDVSVSLRGTFNCSRVVLPGMIDRGSGVIINLIGGGTAAPIPVASGYSVSKTGVMRLTECIEATVRGKGINVFAIAPGLVDTAMTQRQRSSEAGQKYMAQIIERFKEGGDVPPEKAAALCVELVSGRFDALSGRAISANEDLSVIEGQMADDLAGEWRSLRLLGFTPDMRPLPRD